MLKSQKRYDIVKCHLNLIKTISIKMMLLHFDLKC